MKKHARYHNENGCPVAGALNLIGGKWKGLVLYHLLGGTLRFNELGRRLKGITQRMLTKQLRELEAAGLVKRKVYPIIPPRVEYSLTSAGESLRPVLVALLDWGRAHFANGEVRKDA